MKEKSKKKVVVGISGGVDSSVSLALLKERGFAPIGLFMDMGVHKEEAKDRARETCRLLDVPFEIADKKEKFKKKVMDYFLESYKIEETPNPCVVCNRELKFKTLFEHLMAMEADYVATGHYARVSKTALYRGKDKEKDQSYFLWGLKREWLLHLLFPLGEMKKSEVRKKAKELDLPVAKAEESQEVCFIDTDTPSFLRERLGFCPGKIVNVLGEELGEHSGLFYYTLGQRKGIGLSGGPYYVLAKDTENNRLVVTKNADDLLQKEFEFRKANFLKKVELPFAAQVKVRYNTMAKKGLVKKNKVILDTPLYAITPGQSVVFYKGEELVGGGVIK